MKLYIKRSLILMAIISILFQNQATYIFNINLFTYSDEILVLLLFLFAVYLLLKRKVLNLLPLKLLTGVIVFSLIGIFSAYVNSDFELSNVLASNLLSVKFFLVVVSCMVIDIKEDTIKYILKCFEFIAIVAIIVAIINIFLPDLYITYFPWGYTKARFGIISPSSIFEHPGTYGWFLMLIASYHYVVYLKRGIKSEFIKFIIYTLFSLLSMKAKVILSLVVTILLGNFFTTNNKVSIRKILLASVISFAVAFTFRNFLFNTFIQYFTAENGITARSALNINSVNIIKDYFPMGVGFGKFGTHYARINYSEVYYEYGMNGIYGLTPSNPNYATDVFWPAIFGETGFLGTIVFVFCMYLIYKELKKNLLNNMNFIMPLWALIVLAQALVESLGAPTFNTPPQNVIIALILTTAMKRESNGIKENKILNHTSLNSYHIASKQRS